MTISVRPMNRKAVHLDRSATNADVKDSLISDNDIIAHTLFKHTSCSHAILHDLDLYVCSLQENILV